MSRVICAILCVSVICAGGSSACAAHGKAAKNTGIEASAAVDKASGRIGDTFTYTITVKAQKNIEVESPQGLAENVSGFGIKDFGSSARGLFGKKIFKQWYLLDTYASGVHTIPPAVVKYREKGQTDWLEVRTNEVTVEVRSVLDNASDKADIRDIRGPKDFPRAVWFYTLVAGVLVSVSGAAFGFILVKKRHKGPGVLSPPAHIIAYTALAELEKKDYIHRGQIKAFYSELSDIVRHYLENRFNIRAPEMTTEEFLIKVKEDSSLSSEQKSLLRDFLTDCDLVKFARYQPEEEQASAALASARRLIDQTKQENTA